MQKDHELITINVVSELIEKGFTCYLDCSYNFLDGDKQKRVVPDIVAMKKDMMLVIEIGYLCRGVQRLKIIRKVFPKAKIIWVTNLFKNFRTPADQGFVSQEYLRKCLK